MESFRIFFRNRAQYIVGGADFVADSASSALRIGDWIARSCSDECVGYDILQEGRHLATFVTTPPASGENAAKLNESEQQIARNTAAALQDECWQIGKNKGLLDALQELTRTADSSP